MEEPTPLADHPGPLPPATSPRRPSLAKRALTFAKYLPAVLCGVLLLVWVVSWFFYFFGYLEWANGNAFTSFSADCALGTIRVSHDLREHPRRESRVIFFAVSPEPDEKWFGSFYYRRYSEQENIFALRHSGIKFYRSLEVPLPALLTLLLPFAIGCLNRFHFPLWSWFAWTALIAVELTYYLR